MSDAARRIPLRRGTQTRTHVGRGPQIGVGYGNSPHRPICPTCPTFAGASVGQLRARQRCPTRLLAETLKRSLNGPPTAYSALCRTCRTSRTCRTNSRMRPSLEWYVCKRLFAETPKRSRTVRCPHTFVASGSPNRISTTTIRAGASTAQPHGDPGAQGFRKID